MITLTFANGTKLENLRLNGTAYVSEAETDTSFFTPAALKTMTVSGDGEEKTYYDVVFIQQTKLNGEYYLDFRERTREEKLEERLEAIENSYKSIFNMTKYTNAQDNAIPLELPMYVKRSVIYEYGGSKYVCILSGIATEKSFDRYFIGL